MADIPKNLGSLKALKERAKKAHEETMLWEPLLRDTANYVTPNRNLYNKQPKGAKKMQHVYDSTAVESIQIGASKLQKNIAPIWREWAKLEPTSDVKNSEDYKQREKEIKELLEEQTDVIFENINNSNFATIFHEGAIDLLVGTTTLKIDEHENQELPTNIIFESIPQPHVSFEEGPYGTIETHWRQRVVKARNLEREYKGFEPSAKIRRTIEKKPEDEIKITEGLVYDFKGNVFYGVVWVEDEHRLSWSASFEDSSPFVTARYLKVSGETRGRGPAIQLLPDIKSLNKVKEFILKKAALELSGVYTGVHDAVTNL